MTINLDEKQKEELTKIGLKFIMHSLECDNCLYRGLIKCNIAIHYAKLINEIAGV